MNSTVSSRIAILRFLLIFGVIVLHTPKYVPMHEVGPGVFDQVKAFFQLALFRASVPVLTFVSGYLLYRSSLDLDVRKLARKKISTLVIPFLVFNLLMLAMALLVQMGTGIQTSVDLLPFRLDVWLDAAFGLTSRPINYPLSFLRDLIVLMALAPLFGYALRRAPLAGLAAVSVIFWFNFDGLLVRRDVMAILFYIGGMAAIGNWNMERLDRYRVACLAILLAAALYFVAARNGDLTYFRLFSPLLVWPAASLLVGTWAGARLEKLSKYAFFMFVAHAPVLLATSLMYSKVDRLVPYPLYWVAAPVVTCLILIGVHKAAMALMPGLFSFITGQAAKKPKAAAAPAAVSLRL